MKTSTFFRLFFALTFVMMFSITTSFAQDLNKGKGELVNFNHYWDDGTWAETETGLEPKMIATPNPATAESLRVFYAQLRGETELALYNVSGKLIANGQIGTNNVTAGSFDFQIASLTSGIYFVRMTSRNYSSTQKVIVR